MSSKLKLILPIVFLLFIIVGIVGIVRIYRPYPIVEVKLIAQNVVLPGKLSVTFADQGESAVGTENFGVIAASDDQTAVPIASLTKMMTAYIVLKTHPLKPGEDGPTLVINAQDEADYQNNSQKGGSVFKVALGESLTERQLLEGLLLPSGNNIANTLGRWVSGTDADFVLKMNEVAQSLGMTETNYADACGVNPATVSNAVDQIKIAQAAMKDPVFRDIVAMPQTTLPLAGTVYNVNWMLGKHGVVGIKTGSTSQAGGCFVSATPLVVGKEKHYIIAAVLGQKTVQSLQSALDANVQILDQVRDQFKLYPITQPTSGFGQISSAWHTTSELRMTQPVQIFGYPGMKVSFTIKDLKTQLPILAGENVATLSINSDQEVQAVPLQSAQQIEPPALLWRLLRF
ncbi:MAG: D-alanyl-D-alanine carboxypeptidase [Desulfitobacteriaceae bacterium]